MKLCTANLECKQSFTIFFKNQIKYLPIGIANDKSKQEQE